MQRIQTVQDLLDFTIGRYRYYNDIFLKEKSSNVTVYYLKDFLNDLLLIQRFASENNDGKGREEGSANVS